MANGFKFVAVVFVCGFGYGNHYCILAFYSWDNFAWGSKWLRVWDFHKAWSCFNCPLALTVQVRLVVSGENF